MKRRSRDTLRGYFVAGRRPTQDDFSDLIESMLNINDEGFNKTRDDGLCVTSLSDSNALMSFYHANSSEYRAEWAISFGSGTDATSGRDRLAFRRPGYSDKTDDHPARPPLLTLDASALVDADEAPRVGVNTAQPRHALDVTGTVRADGRLGREMIGDADGHYQALTPYVSGCHAYEVVAGVGHRGTGRFALMRAIALNTFNPIWWDNLFFLKKRIRAEHAYYSRRSDRLQLRWAPRAGAAYAGHGHDASYQLQIRTRADYMADARVDGKVVDDAKRVYFRAYVTQLWFDDLTTDFRPEPPPT